VTIVVIVPLANVVFVVPKFHGAELQEKEHRHHQGSNEHDRSPGFEIHLGLLDPVENHIDVPGLIKFPRASGNRLAGYRVDASAARFAVHKSDDQLFEGLCLNVGKDVEALLEGHGESLGQSGQMNRAGYAKLWPIRHEQVDDQGRSRRHGGIDVVSDPVGFHQGAATSSRSEATQKNRDQEEPTGLLLEAGNYPRIPMGHPRCGHGDDWLASQ